MTARRFGLGAPAAAVGLQLLACSGPVDVVNPPPPPPPSGVTLLIVAEPSDRPTADRLGWSGGLPGVDINLTPIDSSSSARILRSDTDGRVNIGSIAANTYVASAARWLTDSERARLGGQDDAIGFTGRVDLTIGTGTSSATIAIPASRRRSIVISEWAFNVGVTPPLDSYSVGGYFEVYNNSDSTISLDGLALGKAVSYDYDLPSAPCAASAQFSNDPQGVWTLMYQIFPGKGTDYPLLPGRAATIATDAIDHGAFYPDGLDLTRADFEFVGPADVDNPAVPNMVDTGFNPDPSGHGMFFGGLGSVAFLSRPIQESSLPMARYFGGPSLHPRIPAQAILDVVAIRTKVVAPYPECSAQVHGQFDRLSFSGRGTNELVEFRHSVERQASPITAGGRVVLQHSRTSDRDFRRGDRSIGAVPSRP